MDASVEEIAGPEPQPGVGSYEGLDLVTRQLNAAHVQGSESRDRIEDEPLAQVRVGEQSVMTTPTICCDIVGAPCEMLASNPCTGNRTRGDRVIVGRASRLSSAYLPNLCLRTCAQQCASAARNRSIAAGVRFAFEVVSRPLSSEPKTPLVVPTLKGRRPGRG